MFCPKCGSENRDGATFCEKCGSQILESETGLEKGILNQAGEMISKVFCIRNIIITVFLCLIIVTSVFAWNILQSPIQILHDVEFDISGLGLIHNGEIVLESGQTGFKNNLYIYTEDSTLYISTSENGVNTEEIEDVISYKIPNYNNKPEKIAYVSKDFNIYLYDIVSKKSEEIDSQISSKNNFQYVISDNGKYVAYTLESDENLRTIYLYDGNNSKEIPTRMEYSNLLAVTNTGNVILNDTENVYIVNEKDMRKIAKNEGFEIKYSSLKDEILFSTEHGKNYMILYADKLDKPEHIKFPIVPIGGKYYYPQLKELKKYWAYGGGILYYVNSKDNIKKIALASDFKLSENAKTVIYSTGSGLYRSDYNGSKPVKIYSGRVLSFVISKSADQVYLINADNELIYVKNGQKPIELSFGIKKLVLNEDGVLFCLDKSDDLYYAKNGNFNDDAIEYDIVDLYGSLYNNYVLYERDESVFINRRGTEFK